MIDYTAYEVRPPRPRAPAPRSAIARHKELRRRRYDMRESYYEPKPSRVVPT